MICRNIIINMTSYKAPPTDDLIIESENLTENTRPVAPGPSQEKRNSKRYVIVTVLMSELISVTLVSGGVFT
jgi:hypothetical protein